MAKSGATVHPLAAKRRLAFFERYLTLWVALCMGAGVLLGRFVPAAVGFLRGLEFGRGSTSMSRLRF